jgi:hypothetical protein
VTFSGLKKNILEKDKLNNLHKSILQIALDLRKKHRTFDVRSLFEKCCRELPNPEPEIESAVRDLYRLNYLVEGKILLKQDILENDKRKKIYLYILQSPGAHERELRNEFNLGAYEARVHLDFLTQYKFIRRTEYKNKVVYFPIDFPEDREKEALLFRNDTIKMLYERIKGLQKVRLSELADDINAPYTTVQSQLKDLLEEGFINKIQEENTTYYVLPEITAPTLPAEAPAQSDQIEIKREYDYLGGQIRFKFAVRNFSNMAIHNIGVNINPSDQFVPDTPQQTIANLPPNTTRGLDFLLSPLACGQSKVFGSVTYEDAYGKVHSIPVQPKEISIKCPLVQPLMATQSEVNDWIKNLKRGAGQITYSSIPDREAFRIGREQVSALDLNEIKADPDQMWGLYSGQVKVTGKNMVVKLSVANPHIVLEVWAEDLNQTTGFIAYITNMINIALEGTYKLVRKTEDVTNKIINLMKLGRTADEIFLVCTQLGQTKDITDRLTGMQQVIEQLFPDSPLIPPMKAWNSKLQSTFESSAPLDPSIATELQSKAIEWLQKICELYQHHMKTYQETFDDYNQISEEFTSGLALMKERVATHEKTYGLGLLSFILVLDKKSGLTIFERNLGDLKINPDLVGGFLHALQSFGFEISAKETSMKTLSYENYQFQIETGDYVRAALILRGVPNAFIISKLQDFVKQFEQIFGEKVLHFSGDMETFTPANSLFDQIFK